LKPAWSKIQSITTHSTDDFSFFAFCSSNEKKANIPMVEMKNVEMKNVETKNNEELITAAKAITEQSYDEVPYPGGAFRSTHPCHLSMVAALCGVESVAPARSRVLELGCSMGSNLIPMAQDLPEAEFVGIDLSARQIAEGQEVLEQLDLSNIRLEHRSILDVDDSFGNFDYIICHGVYSWVDHDTQRAILNVAQRLLSPVGILNVSYNTYPGWHMRGVVRDMMRYHVSDFQTPREKIGQARGLLSFLVKYAKTHSEAYATLLKEEAKVLEDRLDSYIYHEHLEEVNEPLYFHEFVRRADAAGLRYLADSSVATMVAQTFDESAAEILREAPLLRREQYMDFLRARMFRSSLLCHPDVRPDYTRANESLGKLHIALKQPFAGRTATGDETVWKHPGGQLTTQSPITEAVELINSRQPGWVSVAELLDEISDEKQRQRLQDALMMGFIKGVFNLADNPPSVCSTISEKPLCTPLSRLQAKASRNVTNRMHVDFKLQPQTRFLVGELDGTQTADDLAKKLGSAIQSGRFQVSRDGEDVSPDGGELLELVRGEFERLRLLAILVG
jgi:methyltransferase-like protein/cyclopropane fatty-acyl-phospholipid synthase-like methyltransferase